MCGCHTWSRGLPTPGTRHWFAVAVAPAWPVNPISAALATTKAVRHHERSRRGSTPALSRFGTTSRVHGEGEGREGDTGGRMGLVTQRGQSCAEDHKLLTSALRYVNRSRPPENLRRGRRGDKTHD